MPEQCKEIIPITDYLMIVVVLSITIVIGFILFWLIAFLAPKVKMLARKIPLPTINKPVIVTKIIDKVRDYLNHILMNNEGDLRKVWVYTVKITGYAVIVFLVGCVIVIFVEIVKFYYCIE